MTAQSLYLAFGATLFCLGVMGAVVRRNMIVVLMSIELMLNGVNVTFVTFSYFLNNLVGQIFAVFVITVAACEAAVGLAILIALFRLKPTVQVDEINLLKW
ncbi:MAG: NADH-quinone oxidoreductase subunit NuoK [Candidatus Omnitrophica bacterium]|nr:NADH-quinone oxidoreductase subunit NuoK [Candidatus Omnitrophota bacterium]